MSATIRTKNWLLPKKPARLLTLVGTLLMVLAAEFWYRRWDPTHTVVTEHYVITSSATVEQTQEVAGAIESLYAAYGQTFTNFPQVYRPHPKLKVKLFKDRAEFRRCNRGVRWAEAFYRNPYCHAYYSAAEPNPCHWMLHEAVHQLNREVAGWTLTKWCDEGVATYFSTSVLRKGRLRPGLIDPNTYPIWWLDSQAWTGDLGKDLAGSRVIPLGAIVSGRGGPDIDEHFNLYYLHWWSLCHFLFEGGERRYRAPFFQVIAEGGTLASFEKHIGPIDRIQTEWYRHLLAPHSNAKTFLR